MAAQQQPQPPNIPKQTNNNININFRMILTECISKEMNINNNHNNNNHNNNMINIPNIDYSTFVSLNKNQFCKLLKEQSNIAHGRGVKIHKTIKEILHSQTNDNNSNHEIRLDSKLRDHLHWLHIDDDEYASEIINQCWNEMINNNEIKRYKDNQDFQSKIAVMLFTMISDQRVTKTIHKILNNNSMSHILYDKSIKAIQNKDYNKALLYLDQTIAFKSNHTTQDLYKIFIKKSDCHLSLKQYENVINLAKKCIDIQPQSIKAYLNAGNAYMELHQFENAKDMFDKAYILAQNNPNSNENIKLLQDELPISQLHMHTHDKNNNNIVSVNYDCGNIIKLWMANVFDDKNDVIMEYEASQNNCQSYQSCPCLHRIINVLKIYKIWNSKYPDHWQESMLSVMKQMKYTNAILNDFFHIKLVHIHDDNIWEYISKYVGYCNDTKSKCIFDTRNDRKREECGTVGTRKSLYCGMYQSEEIAMLQTLDVIHSYLMHHHNGHNPVYVQTDNDNDNDIEMDETDEKKLTNCNIDSIMQNRIKDKFVTNVTDDNEFKSLNFGVFFVYSSKNKSDDIRLVRAKYKSLKEELLNNNIYSISQYEWMDINIRVKKVISTLYSKQKWIAHNNGSLNICNGIAPGTPIQMDQLIALFITINFENLSKLFVSNGCRLRNENNLHNLKKRHSEIATWSLKLRQAVWYFGTFCGANECFYHGFNKKILFNNYDLTIELPLFVTRSLDLLSSHSSHTNDNANGIIFKLSGCGNTGSSFGYPYFATSMLTDFNYTNNSEAIFFHCNLALNDILQYHRSYDIYLKSLYLFEKIVGGYYYFNGLMQYEMNIISMMKAYLFKNESNNIINSKIPIYIQQLFDYFCQDLQCNDIWFVPSELNKLSKGLKELLFNVWKTRNEIKIQFVQEFQWNIAGDILLTFHSLLEHSAMTGPIFCCKIDEIDGKEQELEESDDDDLKMLQNDKEQPVISIDKCAIFIPYCRKSTMRKNDCGEFGLILQKLPLDVTSILFEYEVYCPEAAYSLRVPPQKWMTVGENVAFTSFKTSKINNLSPFTYNVALKIKQIK